MIVNCPACGTPASIEPAYFGKKLRCANPTCRQTFRVSPDGTVQMELARPQAPRTYDWQQPQSPAPGQSGTLPGVAEGDWLSAPPPRPGDPRAPQPTYQQWQPEAQPQPGEVVVAAVETGDEEDDDDNEYVSTHKTGEYSYGKKKNKALIILIGMLVVLGLASVGAYAIYNSNKASRLAKLEEDFNKAFSNRRWDEVMSLGQKFNEENKDASKTKIAEFKVAFAELQTKLAPSQLSSLDNIKQAVTTFNAFHKTNQAAPQYKDLRKEVTEAAYSLVKAASEFLEKSPDNVVHTDLQPVLATAETLRDGLPDKGDELEPLPTDANAKFKSAGLAVAANIAKQNWLGQFQEIVGAKNLGRIDSILNDQKELVKQHPSLEKDPELAEKLADLKRLEPTWVMLRPEREDVKMAPTKVSFGQSISISTPVKTREGVEDDNGVVLAMARGTLYGLAAKTGKSLWTLRVGQDLRELPPRAVLGGDQPDLVFVVTTEDEGKTYLSQMNSLTGERNWRRPLPGPCPAGATLIAGNRLLAVPHKDAAGNSVVAILEAATGKKSAEYVIPGYDISASPAYDRGKDRLFVPVDRGRIFVLDLANKRCSAVVYSEHGAGQLRGSPLIIDTALIVCVASGAGTGSTRVKPYDIATDTPVPLQEIVLDGHVSSTPYVEGGDTVGIVTDNGYLTLLGVRKEGAPATASGSTPVYILASPIEEQKKMLLKIEAGSEIKTDPPKSRVSVAHASLNDWWVFSHDHLIRNVYDPFHKQLLPSPMGALPLGYPLHRAEVSPDTRLVIVVTQPRGESRMMASAIDRTTGKIVWQFQLGTEASQDPVTLGEDVAMLDRGGAIFYVKASELREGVDWQKVGQWPGLPLAAASHRLVKSPNGQVLVSVSFNPTRARMIVRKIDLKGQLAAQTKEFPHTFAPVGTPAALDDGTVYVPCKDGNIYQFNFATGGSGSLFTWRDPVAPANADGHLLLASPTQLLATNGLNKIYRWDRNAQGTWRRNTNNIEISGRITTNLCKLPDGKVAVGDSAQNLHCLTLAGLGMARQWNVHGAITKGPFLVGAAGLGCVVDGRQLWWVNSTDDDNPRTFAPNDVVGVVGDGAMVGGDLLVAVLRRHMELGMVASYVWLDPATGKEVHQERLPVGLAPASGPTPLGKHRAFAPLTDGTVRILQKSAAATAANPQS